MVEAFKKLCKFESKVQEVHLVQNLAYQDYHYDTEFFFNQSQKLLGASEKFLRRVSLLLKQFRNRMNQILL